MSRIAAELMPKFREMSRPKEKKLMVEVAFSEREMEYILLRYKEGKTFDQIAEEMGITKRMVRSYSHNVIRRLNIVNNAGSYGPTTIKVMQLLSKHGILDEEEE